MPVLALQAVLATAQVTAIKAGRVVDPDAGTVAQNQVILVEGGKITAIGGDVKVPSGAKVIDLSRATVSPGLVDAHTHLCMGVQEKRDAGNYYFTTLVDPDAYRSIQGVVNAKTMLEAGFTSVRDIGNEGRFACVQVRKAIQRGLIPGPTMITAGRIIAPYGGQFHLQPDKPGLAEPEYYFADTHDEMVKAVRENVHFGATVIKIVVDDQQYIYSIEDIVFLKNEAARAGMKLAAHAWTEPGAHNAAEAGVASIEHGFDMTDADLEIAKKNGVVLVGTEYLANGDTTAVPPPVGGPAGAGIQGGRDPGVRHRRHQPAARHHPRPGCDDRHRSVGGGGHPGAGDPQGDDDQCHATTGSGQAAGHAEGRAWSPTSSLPPTTRSRTSRRSSRSTS